jgi:UDP-N-acetyl-D-glucosamine dehydrogenase
MLSVKLSAEALEGYDAVIVATNHRAFDWKLIGLHSRLIIDTRNALASAGCAVRGRLVKA